MKKENRGFTFVELLISIAIIVIISVYFWADLHADSDDIVRQETERVAADIRQTRALTVARVEEKSTGQFPIGGYGVHFYNSPPRYIIYADTDNALNEGYQSIEDIKLREVILNSEIEELVELGGIGTDFYVRFAAANEIYTSVDANQADFYAIGIYANNFRGNIRIAESTEDGFSWTNVGVDYEVIPPTEPPSGGGGGKTGLEYNT